MQPPRQRTLTLSILLCLCAAATTAPSTQPADSILKDPTFDHTGGSDGWQASALNHAQVSVAKDPAASADHPALLVKVDKVTGTDWNAQIFQSGLSILQDHKYRFTFTAKASAARKIAVFIQEQQSPYKMLTEGHAVDLTTDASTQTVEMAATADSTDGKLTIAVGQVTGTITLSDMSLERVGDLDAPQ
jgi:hypothetical protein